MDIFLVTKLGRYIGILSELKHYLSVHILQILYSSMINSHLNYTILAWDFTYTWLSTSCRVIYTIPSSRYHTLRSPVFKSQQLLTLDDMLKLHMLKFYNEYLYNKLSTTSTASALHSYNMRNSALANWMDNNCVCQQQFIYLPAHTRLLATFATQSLGLHKKCYTISDGAWHKGMLHPVYYMIECT